MTHPLSKVRPAEIGDIDQMLKLDEIAFTKGSKYRQSSVFLRDWISRYPDNVFVLEDQNKNIRGRTECLPLRPDVLQKLKECRCSLDNSLINEFLLPLETMRLQSRPGGCGNTLFVGMVAIDPVSKKEGYTQASPLFQKLGEKFTELRMSAVVGRSHTKAAELVWRHQVGGTELWRTSDRRTIVWAFDKTSALRNSGAGLSVVYFTLWPDQSSEGILGFTHREREIMAEICRGVNMTNKDLGTYFKVSENTIHKHVCNMIQKAKDKLGKTMNRPQLAIYCQAHPVEIAISVRKSS